MWHPGAARQNVKQKPLHPLCIAFLNSFEFNLFISDDDDNGDVMTMKLEWNGWFGRLFGR